MGVGLAARTEKNFESRRVRDWSAGSIPSLWSGLLDRASALLKEPGLWMMWKLNWERKRNQ